MVLQESSAPIRSGTGRLRSRSFEGRDGQTRFVNEISLTDVQFLGRGTDGGSGGGDAPYESEGGMDNMAPPSDEIDDLPF